VGVNYRETEFIFESSRIKLASALDFFRFLLKKRRCVNIYGTLKVKITTNFLLILLKIYEGGSTFFNHLHSYIICRSFLRKLVSTTADETVRRLFINYLYIVSTPNYYTGYPESRYFIFDKGVPRDLNCGRILAIIYRK
jgi:hypothetical protein